jgi:hypothetical protein
MFDSTNKKNYDLQNYGYCSVSYDDFQCMMVIEQLLENKNINCIGQKKILAKYGNNARYDLCICGEKTGYKLTFYARGDISAFDKSKISIYASPKIYDHSTITGIDTINRFMCLRDYEFINHSVKNNNKKILSHIRKNGKSITPLKKITIRDDRTKKSTRNDNKKCIQKRMQEGNTKKRIAESVPECVQKGNTKKQKISIECHPVPNHQLFDPGESSSQSLLPIEQLLANNTMLGEEIDFLACTSIN